MALQKACWTGLKTETEMVLDLVPKREILKACQSVKLKTKLMENQKENW